MRFASLGSGSQGNALVVEADETRVLIDCGFPVRTVLERLARLGITPGELTGILVTHEHTDHMAGVFKLASRYSIPVFLTHGTLAAASPGAIPAPDCRLVSGDSAFSLGAFEILPFPVPHDAREPVQYVLSDGRRRLGVLTDAGMVTPHMVECLQRCDALVLECNHDRGLLETSSYPRALQRRIGGRLGHLDNEAAASLVRHLDPARLQHLVAAHLSEQNNRPELAQVALAKALGCLPGWVGVASQEDGFPWRSIA